MRLFNKIEEVVLAIRRRPLSAWAAHQIVGGSSKGKKPMRITGTEAGLPLPGDVLI
jgi:hypothetical protein